MIKLMGEWIQNEESIYYWAFKVIPILICNKLIIDARKHFKWKQKFFLTSFNEIKLINLKFEFKNNISRQ